MDITEEKIYAQQVVITKAFLQDIPLDHERNFILKFLGSIPVDKLKMLVNFKEIDPIHKELWDEADNNEYLRNKLLRLLDKKSVEFNVEIKI